jgi:putative serine protease PepD
VSDFPTGPAGITPDPQPQEPAAVPPLPPSAPLPAAPVWSEPVATGAVPPAPVYAEPASPYPAAPAYQPPVPPLPSGPPEHRGNGRIAGLAISIAIVGVILSAVVGGTAGYFGARFGATTSAPAPAVSTAQIVANSSQEPVAAAAAIALPSVVNIDVTGSTSATGLPLGHPTVPTGGTGSGVAFKSTSDGGTYILTNDHVVSGASAIVVTPQNGEPLDATLVGTDPQTDIAVVKVNAKLQLITVADSEKLVVGQTVVAIGSPFGLQQSVSSGVVSALHRAITSITSATGSSSSLVDAIQTDAAINPGNSGGALVDRQGRLVGIDSAIYTESGSSAGVGFAIPSNTAVSIADQLISTGKATHPFLGVQGMTVTASDAAAAGLSPAEGALIESVIPGTGAAKAGLRKGDIVTQLNNTPIRTMDDLLLAVRRSSVGDNVTLTIWRDKAQITVQMTVGDKPASVS